MANANLSAVYWKNLKKKKKSELLRKIKMLFKVKEIYGQSAIQKIRW